MHNKTKNEGVFNGPMPQRNPEHYSYTQQQAKLYNMANGLPGSLQYIRRYWKCEDWRKQVHDNWALWGKGALGMALPDVSEGEWVNIDEESAFHTQRTGRIDSYLKFKEAVWAEGII